MDKNLSKYLVVGIAFLFFFFLVDKAFAAELTFKLVPNATADDKAITIEVRIDPQGKTLNVVEGAIIFHGVASDKLAVQIENGQSILPLWPTPPEYIESKKAINFSGGIPNGFDREGLLFRLRLSPTLSGDLNISYLKGNVYLNDGKGTKGSVTSQPLNLRFDKIENKVVIEKTSRLNLFPYVILLLIIVVFIIVVLKYGGKKILKK